MQIMQSFLEEKIDEPSSTITATSTQAPTIIMASYVDAETSVKLSKLTIGMTKDYADSILGLPVKEVDYTWPFRNKVSMGEIGEDRHDTDSIICQLYTAKGCFIQIYYWVNSMEAVGYGIIKPNLEDTFEVTAPNGFKFILGENTYMDLKGKHRVSGSEEYTNTPIAYDALAGNTATSYYTELHSLGTLGTQYDNFYCLLGYSDLRLEMLDEEYPSDENYNIINILDSYYISVNGFDSEAYENARNTCLPNSIAIFANHIGAGGDERDYRIDKEDIIFQLPFFLVNDAIGDMHDLLPYLNLTK